MAKLNVQDIRNIAFCGHGIAGQDDAGRQDS